MSDSKKRHKKATKYDLLVELINKLKLHELPYYQKFNLVITVLLVVAAFTLALPPVLALINNMVISIGNIIVALLEKPTPVQSTNNSDFTSIVLSLIMVLGESILCMILCHCYKKENVPSDEK